VIEGPLSNQRTNAVVAEVHKLLPNKPIRYLVNTHNNFDHLGGVRGFVAEGATVITDDATETSTSRSCWHRSSGRCNSIGCRNGPLPDRSGNAGLQTFIDRYTISDGNQIVELYHVDALNYSDNMLIAYLPKDKIVVNADLYGPPPAGGNLANVSNNAVVLYRNLKRLKLDVATHVPIHADFERIVGPVAARTLQG
jgi:metallo-beta-lactamase superfamily protein